MRINDQPGLIRGKKLCKMKTVANTVLVDTLLFFFSSRRRHTRCSRDWSSDVYSSDLMVSEVICDRGTRILLVSRADSDQRDTRLAVHHMQQVILPCRLDSR